MDTAAHPMGLRTFTRVGDLEKGVTAAKNPINFEIGKRKILPF